GTVFTGVATTVGASQPHTETDLVSGDTYDFYVRGNCAAGPSIWSGPYPFTTLPPPPANDECGGATPVPVNAGTDCTSTIDGSLLSSTDSMEPAAVCGNDTDNDVWFSFVPSTSSVLLELSGNSVEGDFTSVRAETFSGACGSLNSLGCSERLTGLTPGATYFIRAYDFPGSEADFTICITEQPDPPGNDNCSGAIPLAVSLTPECGSSVAATTAGATQSLPACGSGVADDDVWFSFTATAERQLLYVTDIVAFNGFDRDFTFEVFEGACGGLTSVFCGPIVFSFDDPPAALENLTAGTAYFLRIYSEDDVTTLGFNICLATPPANDECAGAIAVPVNPSTSCSNVVGGSTIGASRSGTDCGIASADDDVWFFFDATATSHFISLANVAFTGGFNQTMFFELTEADDCTGGTILQCSDVGSIRRAMTGLTPGQRYYLRIFTRISTAFASFDLCLSTPPANDECAGAFTAVVNPDLTSTLTTSASTVGGTESGSLSGACSPNSDEDDTWYRFTAIAEEHFIKAENVVVGFGSSNPNNTIVYVYEDDCDNLTTITCDFLSDNTDVMTVSGLTAGQDYLIRVYTQSFSSEINFDLVIQTDPALLPVELVSFTGQAQEKKNVFNWITATEASTAWHVVERSFDGNQRWQEVARTQGAGDSNEEQSYVGEDPLPQGSAYYRLRTIDLDGTEHLSGMLFLERLGDGPRQSVYPNPARAETQLQVYRPKATELTLYLTDASGKVLRTDRRAVAAGVSQIPVPLTDIPAGLYFLAVEDGNGQRELMKVVRR
ncbi:MAG: T9SS type A sorting domain-containing protein, partial [Bacteroidota bacterium]